MKKFSSTQSYVYINVILLLIILALVIYFCIINKENFTGPYDNGTCFLKPGYSDTENGTWGCKDVKGEVFKICGQDITNDTSSTYHPGHHSTPTNAPSTLIGSPTTTGFEPSGIVDSSMFPLSLTTTPTPTPTTQSSISTGSTTQSSISTGSTTQASIGSPTTTGFIPGGIADDLLSQLQPTTTQATPFEPVTSTQATPFEPVTDTQATPFEPVTATQATPFEPITATQATSTEYADLKNTLDSLTVMNENLLVEVSDLQSNVADLFKFHPSTP